MDKILRHVDISTVSTTRKKYWEKKLTEEEIEFKSTFMDISKRNRIEFDIPEDRLNQWCQKLLIPYDAVEFTYDEM